MPCGPDSATARLRFLRRLLKDTPQVFGPFVPATMMNPAMCASPDAYNNMMASVTDAKAAEHWQRAVEEKYGLKPGDTAPTMHNWWPWGMAPTVPVPTPAQ